MAKTTAKNKLKEQYEKVCNEYVKKFCNKQEMDFDDAHWIANCVGDTVWDINSNQKKGLITTWHNETVDNPLKSINYFSYSKGLRFEDVEDLID